MFFLDFYTCLSDEDEQSAVNNILQDLKEREVLDFVMKEKLVLDDTTPKKFRDPLLTMEARHRRVRAKPFPLIKVVNTLC